jgi:hypothetical protein
MFPKLTIWISTQAAFLGDPKFPKLGMDFSKGGKIRLYESLYKQYSRLAFSKIQDRPIAIAGLEQRLISAFKIHGGYGVFESYSEQGRGYLGRSLLWQRGSDEKTMTQISFESKERAISVPTWSWMAYKGGIDYMDLPFDGVDWETEEIQSPWTPSPGQSWHTGDRPGSIDLKGVARDFRLIITNENEGQVIYDEPDKTGGRTFKCVVFGRLKTGNASAGQKHYVLIVGRKPGTGDAAPYERVGVGFMPGNCITFDAPGLKVRIR